MAMIPYRRDNGMFNLLDSLERNFFNDSVSGFAQFRTDISEKDDKYMLEAELPGFDAKDINVNVDGDTMTISAEQSSSNDEKDDKGNYIRRERRYGSFSRSFDISGIEADGISADYSNGVLTIDLPKAAEQKPETRQIAVNSKNTQQGMEQGGKAEYSTPEAAQQASQVQENSQPEQYVGGSQSDNTPKQ